VADSPPHNPVSLPPDRVEALNRARNAHPASGRITADSPAGSQTLYRLYNASGELLYVGISGRAWERWHQHAKGKTWWSEVTVTRVEHFTTRAEVEQAERLAIRTEFPKYNKTHKAVAKPQPAGGSRPITWMCVFCKQAIDAGTGYITVDQDAARACRSYWDDIARRNHIERAPLLPRYSAWDLVSGPPEPDWIATHLDCDPRKDSNDYWYDVARASTESDLTDRLLHLSEKSWVQYTNLYGLMKLRRVVK
jgi:predicted GIY-YIG superfamily endonuclease